MDKMVTVVAFNTFNYLRQKWLDTDQDLDQETFDQFTNASGQFIEQTMSLIPGLKSTESKATKPKTGGSLWDAYNKADWEGGSSKSFTNDKKRMFDSQRDRVQQHKANA